MPLWSEVRAASLRLAGVHRRYRIARAWSGTINMPQPSDGRDSLDCRMVRPFRRSAGRSCISPSSKFDSIGENRSSLLVAPLRQDAPNLGLPRPAGLGRRESRQSTSIRQSEEQMYGLPVDCVQRGPECGPERIPHRFAPFAQGGLQLCHDFRVFFGHVRQLPDIG